MPSRFNVLIYMLSTNKARKETVSTSKNQPSFICSEKTNKNTSFFDLDLDINYFLSWSYVQEFHPKCKCNAQLSLEDDVKILKNEIWLEKIDIIDYNPDNYLFFLNPVTLTHTGHTPLSHIPLWDP